MVLISCFEGCCRADGSMPPLVEGEQRDDGGKEMINGIKGPQIFIKSGEGSKEGRFVICKGIFVEFH